MAVARRESHGKDARRGGRCARRSGAGGAARSRPCRERTRCPIAESPASGSDDGPCERHRRAQRDRDRPAAAGAVIVTARREFPVGGTCSSQTPRPCVATRSIEPSSRICEIVDRRRRKPVAEARSRSLRGRSSDRRRRPCRRRGRSSRSGRPERPGPRRPEGRSRRATSRPRRPSLCRRSVPSCVAIAAYAMLGVARDRSRRCSRRRSGSPVAGRPRLASVAGAENLSVPCPTRIRRSGSVLESAIDVHGRRQARSSRSRPSWSSGAAPTRRLRRGSATRRYEPV